MALNQVFTRDDAADLATRIQTFLTNSKHFCELSVIPAVARCEADVMENLSIVKIGIRNEAELHFVFADPILRLLCSYWNLTVCGEVGGNYFCWRVLNIVYLL